MKIVRKFQKQKETKNTVQYKEVDEGDKKVMGTVYVQSAEAEELGDEIKVTVESA